MFKVPVSQLKKNTEKESEFLSVKSLIANKHRPEFED